MGENPNKDVDIQGLYPITSILNHSCTSNTICYAQDNFTFVCRAVTNIKKGEEITTNYFHFHYHFFGRSYRQQELREHWHFTCGCERCKDNTEKESMVDSLVCVDCKDGRLVQLIDRWVCIKCTSVRSTEKINQTLENYWDLIDKTTDFDILGLDDLLPKLQKVFDENHFYILEVKRRIIESIVNYEDLAVSVLEKKVRMCRDHLKVQRCVAPGLSEYRAYISSHIAEPLYWVGKEKYQDNKITTTELKEVMEEVAEHLLLVIQIWGPFKKNSTERIIAEKARNLLKKVDVEYLQKELVQEADEVLQKGKLKSFNSILF